MMKFTTKIKTVADRSLEVFAAIEELKRTQVLVGIPAAKAPRNAAQAKGSPINNAALGYIHNYGLPTKNIPARPFMEPGIKNGQPGIEAGLRKAAESAFDGKPAAMQQHFDRVGLVAQNAIRAKITAGPFVPLSAATIAARLRRGRTGTRPLIDTGQLRASLSYVVRRK